MPGEQSVHGHCGSGVAVCSAGAFPPPGWREGHSIPRLGGGAPPRRFIRGVRQLPARGRLWAGCGWRGVGVVWVCRAV